MKKILLLGFTILVVFLIFHKSPEENIISAKEDLITYQNNVDKKIEEAISNKGFTLENPYIINNPYKISPLTSLIIFNTDKSINLTIKINDKLYKKINGTSFCIPIVNLIQNYKNKIELIADGKIYEHYIETNEILKTEIKISGKNNYQIMASGEKSKHFLINERGEVIWYLDLDTQGFLEPVSKDSFLIGTEESIIEKNVSSFTGLYEINYLGKILKRFDAPLRYHHDIHYLSDNKALVLGTNKEPMDSLYELNLDNGKIEKSIDIIEVLSKANPDIKAYLESSKYGMGTNSIDYLNGNILLSLRNINSIIEIDLKKESLNFIITSDSKMKTYLKDYVISLNKDLLGIHDASYIDGKTISIYNNGYDHSNKKTASASALTLKIKGKKATVKESYQEENKYSYAFGSFHYDNTLSLVNYSYMYEKYPDNPLTYENYYSNIVLYKNKNLKAKIKISDNIYKAKTFSFNLSDEYEAKTYKYYNETIKLTNDLFDTKDIFHEVVNITNHSVELLMTKTSKKIEIIFQNDKHSYIIPYLNTNTFFQLEKGVYSIFFKIDDKLYKYKSKIKIEV